MYLCLDCVTNEKVKQEDRGRRSGSLGRGLREKKS